MSYNRFYSHTLSNTPPTCSAFVNTKALASSVTLAIILFSSTITSLPVVPIAFAQTAPEPLITGGLINTGNPPSMANFNLPHGYMIQPVLWNLTLPTAVTFDDNGSMYIAESGYSYGAFKPIPRILKLDSAGIISVFVDRGLNGPITDIDWNNHNAAIYVSHRGVISAVDGRGHVKDLIVGLPSMGDHQNNQIAFGPDARLYFGQGTTTNSGVAGEDSYAYEWLKTSPEIHDIPGKNITLTGVNYRSMNPLDPQNLTSYATTGAFVPFGHSTTKGEVIPGNAKCSGCIISASANGTGLKMVAWGLRNPYGVAFTADGKKLIVANNGADERGSRRVGNDSDKIDLVNVSNPQQIGNQWFGWPDFYGNAEPVTNPKFISESSENTSMPLQFLIQNHPPVQKPAALVGEGVAVTQLAVSNNTSFGFKGMAFVGEYGTAAPLIHPFAQITQPMPGFKPMINGQRIIMFNPQTNNFTDFLTLKHADKSFRPVGVKFNLNGDALYIVSIGKSEIREHNTVGTLGAGLYPFASIHATVWPYPNTGAVWKMTEVGTNSSTTTTGRTNDSSAFTINGTTDKPITGFGKGAAYLRIPTTMTTSRTNNNTSSATFLPLANTSNTQMTNQTTAITTHKANLSSSLAQNNQPTNSTTAKRPFAILSLP